MKGGLTALATLNPGSSLAEAASFYSQANSEVVALKGSMDSASLPFNFLNSATSQLLTFPYPNPDPLALETVREPVTSLMKNHRLCRYSSASVPGESASIPSLHRMSNLLQSQLLRYVERE